MRQFISILIAGSLLMAAGLATAQDGKGADNANKVKPGQEQKGDHGVVGHEVFSTSTPGGGGQLKSQGVRGKKTPWFISKTAASRLGVSNVVVTYYHCKACRDKAKEDQKKAAEEKKKPKPPKEPKEPPKGEDVPTYDPRFWEWKDGKLVPVQDHSKCPRPEKFECGRHYQWWLKNHKHTEPKKDDDNDHSKCKKPPKFYCGAHYQWWLRNHKHVSSQDSSHSMLPNDYQLIISGTVTAGQPASGTLLDADGVVVSGMVIELSDGEEVTTDENGRFWFIAPEDLDTLILTVAGTQVARAIFATSADRAAEHALNRHEGLDGKTGIVDPIFRETLMTPQFGEIGRAMDIIGYFPAGYSLTMDGEPLQIVARSPSNMTVVLDSDIEPGAHTMELQRDGEIRTLDTFYAIKLQLEPGDRALIIGQKGRMRVRVIGTDQSIQIQVDNARPKILKVLSDGTVRSSGGLVNLAYLDVFALSLGDFQIKLTPMIDFVTLKR